MKILNTHSLVDTVDRFNEALLKGEDWIDQSAGIGEWVSGRLGGETSYFGSFSMTGHDLRKPFRLFTGEKLVSRVGPRHIIAQETMRMLCLIEQGTGCEIEALQKSQERLGEQVFNYKGSRVRQDGMYCCATCSLAFWRAVQVGAYEAYPQILDKALRTLEQHRLESGGWQAFPYYYTMLVLSGLPPELRGSALVGQSESIQRRRKLLQKKRDTISRRRLKILEAIS